MRIVHVIPYFMPAWAYGGPVAVAYNLSRQLVRNGHEVTVYTTDALAADDRVRVTEETVDGIEVRRFRNLSNTVAYNHNIFVSPGILSVVRSDLRRFDVIHMHDYRTIQNVVVHHYATRHRIPYVLQAHGSLQTYFQKGRLKKVFDRLWGHRIMRDAAKVFAVTGTEAEQYRTAGLARERLETVPYGIELSEFEALPPRGEFRQSLGVDDTQQLILYLGRIHRIKGLDLLTRAFAHLSDSLDTARLVISGPDGGYLLALKRLIADLGVGGRVLFTGPLYGEQKLRAYVDADVYVLPSSYEIFGITVLEACACGTPVVVTDRCGIADVVDGQAGLVVPYNEQRLQHALLSILSSAETRQQFGEKGKLLVRNSFNWERIAQRVQSLYESVLRQKC